MIRRKLEGLNRMVYTIQNGCAEVPEMPYDDGARTLFLYTQGTEGNPPEELRQLLHYMEHTTMKNAQNKSLRDIQHMVDEIKSNGEVSLKYMKIFEREEMLINEGFERGQEKERANTERERQRADAAEIKADTEKARADAAQNIADTEKARADAAQNIADTEKARADAAEEKIRKLEAELIKLQKIN